MSPPFTSIQPGEYASSVTDGSSRSANLIRAELPTCMVTPWIDGSFSISLDSSTVSGRLFRHGQLSAEPLQLLISAGQRVRKNVVGPAAAMLLVTPALMPCTAADITVTTNTPTAMPRTVRPVRTLFTRMASNAINTPSNSA
jgi:hypothetical protein